MGNGNMPEGAKQILGWVIVLAVIAFIALMMVVIFGNLSGNVGFSSGTQGYNDTQAVILNYTSSATKVVGQFPTTGVIIGVAILLLILIGILVFLIKKMMGVANAAGGSNASFG